jgi:hypothetical protein
MATLPDSTTPEITRRIAYNPQTEDYDCFIAIDIDPEQYIGSAPAYPEAVSLCRDYTYHYYEDTHTPEKAVQLALREDPAIPREGPYIVKEASTFQAMYLDGLLVGFARTEGEAGLTLRELIAEMQRMEDVASADIEADAALLLELAA